MSITKTFVAGVEAAGAAATLAHSGFDSTGSTHLVAFSKHETNNSTLPSYSDNKGSGTWNKLTQQQNNANLCWGQLHWVKIGTPGASHVVTLNTNAAANFRTSILWKLNSSSGEIALLDEKFGQGDATSGLAYALADLANPGGLSVVSFCGVAESVLVTAYTQGTGWAKDFDNGGAVNSTFGQSRGAETGTLITPQATQNANGEYAMLAAMFKELLASANSASVAHLD